MAIKSIMMCVRGMIYMCVEDGSMMAGCVLEPHACRSSKNDMRRLKSKGRSGFQWSFECCQYISGCVGTDDLVIYRCFWTEGVMFFHKSWEYL